MWPFKQTRSLIESGLFEGFVDCHSHILPGVDDGVETVEEALQILQMYERLGVKKVWLTPHIMEDIPNTTAYLRERFEQLKQHYTGEVQLCLASENMIDALFEERLEQNDLLPLGELGDHLLVEIPFFCKPFDLIGTLKRIQSKGYHPVLAHPERYEYMDKSDYNKLKTMNVKFQLNLLSLVGLYGSVTRRKAQQLLSAGYYNFVGSDLHQLDYFERLINDKKIDLQIIKKIPR